MQKIACSGVPHASGGVPSCARPLSLTKNLLFSASQLGSFAWLSSFLLCSDHTCVFLCVYICMCLCQYVIKVIKIYKYKENHDDVNCNIKVETEIDVYSDVKQAVKWQVFRHMTE